MSIIGQTGLGYHLVKANINFLGEKYTQGMSYFDHLPHQKSASVNIRSYSDEEVLLKEFNLDEHGFQYFKLEENSLLALAIDQYALVRLKDPYATKEEAQLSDQLQQFLSHWGQENKIPGKPVVISHTYRNNGLSAGGHETRPFHFAHVDYSKEDLSDLSLYLGKLHKQAAEKAFGVEMSEDDYKQVKHDTPLNVWIPLQEKPSNNKFAVMDTSSVQDLQQKLQPIAMGEVTIFGIPPGPEQMWVTKKNLTRKDRLILVFKTTLTPHAAFDLEGELRSVRRSLEFRTVFMTHCLNPAIFT